MRKDKGQVSIEMLVIIGVLILGAVVLASIFLGLFSSNIDQAEEIDAKTGTVISGFVDDLIDYTGPGFGGSGQVSVTYTLDLDSDPSGSGVLTGAGTYQAGQTVLINAVANSGYSFVNWTDGSTILSTNNSFTYSMPASNKTLTANFTTDDPTTYTLTINNSPSNGGTVTSTNNSDLVGTCSQETCTYNIASGTTIILTNTPSSNYSFSNWSGAGCSGTGNCNVQMNQDRTVTANYTYTGNYVLNVVTEGTGSGGVISNPSSINCGSVCSASYSNGTSVTLTAIPLSYSEFAGWSGDGCSGTSPTCTVTMDQARNINAEFNIDVQQSVLSIIKGGLSPNNASTIVSNPSGIYCGSNCSSSFNSGENIELNVTLNDPKNYYTIFNTSGLSSCSGLSCSFTIDSDINVIINVHPNTLTVNRQGSGSGIITSNPEGIDCGFTCDYDFDKDSEVTLTANPTPGSTFTGWSGACSGTSLTCTVTMDYAKTVNASFRR